MDSATLSGSVVVVTGASSGVGRAVAVELARSGASVVAAGRSHERLRVTEAAMEAAGTAGMSVICDVTSESAVANLFASALARHGRVNALVNNAGLIAPAPIEEMDLSDWSAVVDVNLTGAFLCTREAFRAMKNTSGGRIVNVGSISAAVPRPNSANYAASKSGLTGLTRATAIEGRRYGIAAGCIHPGNVATEMRTGELPPGADGWNDEVMMSATQVATTVVSMLAMEPGAMAWEYTILPIEQPFLGRG